MFGDRIRELRKGRNMTQQDLADTLGVERSSISKYEKGAAIPSDELKIKLANLFNVTIDYILGREERATVKPQISPAGQSIPVAAIKARRREPDRLYALTGKIFCAGCGSPMRGTCGTGKAGGKYYYYRCRGCGEASIRQEVAEDLVVDALRAVVMDDATLDQLVAAVMELKDELTDRSDLDALTARLKETRTAKTNIMKAIETGVSSRTLAERLTELERAEDELGALIAAEKRKIPDVTPEMVRFYFEQFRKGEVNDPAYRRLLIDTFLRAVYVHPDHLDITFSYEDGTDRPPARVELGEGVCIEAPGGHQMQLIQTLARVGRVFVMSVNRKAPA